MYDASSSPGVGGTDNATRDEPDATRGINEDARCTDANGDAAGCCYTQFQALAAMAVNIYNTSGDIGAMKLTRLRSSQLPQFSAPDCNMPDCMFSKWKLCDRSAARARNLRAMHLRMENCGRMR